MDPIPDVEHNVYGEVYCFSDGDGRMSPNVARFIARRMWELGRLKEGCIPCAVHIRFKGCKGMLTLDPSLSGNKCARAQAPLTNLRAFFQLFTIIITRLFLQVYLSLP